MSEIINVQEELSKEEKYKTLIPQIKNLLSKEYKLISNLSNFIAVIKSNFNYVSWIGFYFYDGEKLYLGPFQGNVACINIEIGKGVCGTAAKTRETIIVPDVNKFDGHIFCDENSKSEIVIPIVKNNLLIGVLDLDSYDYDSFDEIDRKFLEELVLYLKEEFFK